MVKKLLALAFILLAGSAEAQVNWGAYGPGPTPTGVINTNITLPPVSISGSAAPTVGAILSKDANGFGAYLYWGTRGSIFLGTADSGGAYPNPSGNFLTCVGMRACVATSTDVETIMIGAETGQCENSGADNVAVGDNSLGGVNTCTTVATGALSNDVVMGFYAGSAMIIGANNDVYVGYESGDFASSGALNTCVGAQACEGLSAGTLNSGADLTGVGYQVLQNNSTGNNSACFGDFACQANTTANSNVGIGDNCLNANTTGAQNTCLGTNALRFVTGTATNVAAGFQAGTFLHDGSTHVTAAASSVFIGANTEANAANDTNENVIGNGAQGGGSNTTTIGNSSITSTIIPGISASTAADVLCYATLTGVITFEPTGTTCTVSAARFKNLEGIIANAEPMIGSLHIRTGHFRKEFQKDYGTAEHVWIIADEVCKADERLCARDKDGKVRSYDRDGVLAYVVRDLQQQHEEIAHLTAELSHLRHKHR